MKKSTNGQRSGYHVSLSALLESPQLESGIEIKSIPAWLKGDPALKRKAG